MKSIPPNQNLPNLFDIATSELSQDAFITWLLRWASPEFAQADAALHDRAVVDIDRVVNHLRRYKEAYASFVEATKNNKEAIDVEKIN